MKKIFMILFASLLLFGCSTNGVTPEEEVKDDQVEEKEETVKEEPVEEKEEPVAEEVAPEPETDPVADLQTELDDLIAQKEALIAEKQTIGRTMRGPEKGQRMREINSEISAIGQRIGEIKSQLGL